MPIPAPRARRAILAGLGFSTDGPDTALRGILRRLAHARRAGGAPVPAPDLLLLDEPTNYLDLEGALWLEDYLAALSAAPC